VVRVSVALPLYCLSARGFCEAAGWGRNGRATGREVAPGQQTDPGWCAFTSRRSASSRCLSISYTFLSSRPGGFTHLDRDYPSYDRYSCSYERVELPAGLPQLPRVTLFGTPISVHSNQGEHLRPEPITTAATRRPAHHLDRSASLDWKLSLTHRLRDTTPVLHCACVNRLFLLAFALNQL
jgi:hypothetical protein